MANPFVQKVQMFMKMGYDQNQATSLAMGGGANTGASPAQVAQVEKKYAPKGKNKKSFDKIKKAGGGLAEIQAAKKGGNVKKAANQQVKRKNAVKVAIDGGVDPAVATSLGLVKKPKNFNAKAAAGIQVAQAGGGPQDQINVMLGKNPLAKAKASIPGITAAVQQNEQIKKINEQNEFNKNNPIKGDDEYIQQGSGAFEGGSVKDGGAAFRRKRRRRGSSNPQSSANSQSIKITNSNINAAQGGINA